MQLYPVRTRIVRPGDDLASAAHLSMGEVAEKTPVVLIKDAPVDFDDDMHASEEMMMPFRECIFMSAFKG